MEIFATPDEMRTWSRSRRRDGRTIGLVPTMGALHRGHLELIVDAARRCDDVVVSVFVNPLQFDRPTDFDSYPRPIDDDVDVCARHGVAAVYAPTAAAMYPPEFETSVTPGALAEVMEGPMRPGHFDGVATVVTKLFGAVDSDVAVFGQKDYQQLAIIRRMAADLDTGIEIVGHPVVREDDGVALSSRNVRLSPIQRAAAVCVPRSLDAACALARSGEATTTEVIAAAAGVVAREPEASLEYTEVFDASSLRAVEDLTSLERSPGLVRIATAVWFGEVRLIDNRDLFDD
ncbi:pantoate--beta-alanine ligase [Ilumatobacter sp.]|uniref:pantoate--beta-alanine ligase n=1 Tax=Ilumatobacter sp. TaxID=1967498 RepID=UPI003B524469